jgi:hypothetical protein
MCILITRFLQCCQDRFLTVSEGKFSFRSVKMFGVGGGGGVVTSCRVRLLDYRETGKVNYPDWEWKRAL